MADGFDSSLDEAEVDTSLIAEPEIKQKFIKEEHSRLPDEYDELSLPPWIKEAKKKMK